MAFTFNKAAPAGSQPEKEDHDDNGLLDEPELSVSDGGVAKFAAIEVKSGEEQYDLICNLKSKILRFDEGENQWKERGQGDARILQHKHSKKFLFIHRREGTGKLSAQHALVPGMSLKANPSSDKVWVWGTARDYSDDDEGFPETFCVKFASKELADQFRAAFEAATKK